MFRKLRNKLIWINLGITSVVIVLVFSTIYITSTRSADMRPSMPGQDNFIFTEEMEDFFRNTMEEEREAAARELLTTLIISGLLIEVAVAFISYLLADEAIKPVKEAYEAQKIFIANASHEIKTPLAAISANLEAADISGNKFIDNVERETEKLTSLNNELLALARTDALSEIKIEEVDLGQLVRENLKSLEPKLEKIDFKTRIKTGKIKVNTADFMQILGILMDNAIKYADKKISLTLTAHELVVSNDGAKIREEDLVHVFDRFHQTDKSSEGVGLGLAIAKTAAERNKWKLTAESGRRTSFRLIF